MLLDIEAWRTKSASVLARHVRADREEVRKWRLAYFQSRKIPVPEWIETQDGQQQTYLNGKKRTIGVTHSGDRQFYRSVIKGKEVILGPVADGMMAATGRLRTFEKELEESPNRVTTGNIYSLTIYLTRRLIATETLVATSHRFLYPGIAVRKGNGFVLTCTDFKDKSAAVCAIGQVILAAKLVGSSCRMVVACYPKDGPEKVLELGRSLGIEFLTPDDFVASFSSK
jgi:hypothetical protein